MGNGDGTFQGAPELPFVFTGTNLADLNGDKILDGVGVNANPSSFERFDDLLPGKGRRHVYRWTHVANFARHDSRDFILIRLAGFLRPGKTQEATARQTWSISPSRFYGPGGVAGYFLATGNGDGSFNAPVFVTAPTLRPVGRFRSIRRYLSNLFVADVNGDGKADLIYSYRVEVYQTNIYEQGIAVQLSNGDGTFQAPQVIQTYSSTTAPTDLPPSSGPDSAMPPGAESVDLFTETLNSSTEGCRDATVPGKRRRHLRVCLNSASGGQHRSAFIWEQCSARLRWQT